MIGNQYFLLPPQPDPNDRRPRNAFGFLIGFGKAAQAYYEKRDKQIAKKATKKSRKKSKPMPRDCGRPHPQPFCCCAECRKAKA